MLSKKLAVLNMTNRHFAQCDPIRQAEVLREGLQEGCSIRRLAPEAGVSESTARNLLLLLELPLEVQKEIAAGAAYRGHLSLAKQLRRERKQRELARVAGQNERIAMRGCRLIQAFFREIGLSSGYCEQVLGDVLAHLRRGEIDGYLGRSQVKWEKSYREIIDRLRPKNLEELPFLEYLEATIVWCCRWISKVMPNSEVRERAIYLALDEPNRFGA